MYHPFVDDQVYRIERQFRERQAAMARMARQLDVGGPSIWAQLHMRFRQSWARATGCGCVRLHTLAPADPHPAQPAKYRTTPESTASSSRRGIR